MLTFTLIYKQCVWSDAGWWAVADLNFVQKRIKCTMQGIAFQAWA